MVDRTPRKLARLARVRRAENHIEAGALAAINDLLAAAADLLAGAGYNTDVLDDRLPTWRDAVDAHVVPAVEAAYLAGTADSVLTAAAVPAEAAAGGFDATPYAEAHLATVRNRLVGVANTVFDVMRGELRDGWLAGEGIPELAKRVDALLADDQRWRNRARTIARTEAIGANNAGARDAARWTAEALGHHPDQVVKEWLATIDGRQRATHQEASGQQVLGIDSTFTVGAAALTQPGDPNGPGEEVINCRCTVLYLMPGDPGYPTTASGAPMPTTLDQLQDLVAAGSIPDLYHVTEGLAEADLIAVANGTATAETHTRIDAVLTPLLERLASADDDPDPTDDQPANTSTVVVLLPEAGHEVYDIGDEDKHCTLLWFGETDDTTADAIRAAAQAAIAADPADNGTIPATVTGLDQLGDDTPPADVWLLRDEDNDLQGMRDLVLDADPAVRAAWEAQKQWPTFTPHVTIGYGVDQPTLDQAAQVTEITFDRIAVWQGDTQDEYPLGTTPDDTPAPPQEPAVTAAAPETPAPPADTAAGGEDLTWWAVLCPEDLVTGDMRKLTNVEWVEPPFTIMAQFKTAMGHDDAVAVGLCTGVSRVGNLITAVGTWDDPTVNEHAAEARRQNIAGLMRGISVDTDMGDVSFETPEGEPIDGDAMWDLPMDAEVVYVVDRPRIRAATLCYIPAFVEAYLLDSTVADDKPTASVTDTTAAVAASGVALTIDALMASAAPAGPAPASAFAYPGTEALSYANGDPRGLTVLEDGRAFGYAAVWGTCHIGFEGQCITPPTSETNYAHFLTRSYQTSDGEELAVGAITMGTGHAALELGARPAAEHYDNTGTAAIYCTMGEDEVGIWFAGVLSEDLNDVQRRQLTRAGGVSGDWRRIGGNLEMVATLAVNVPGFPIPKVQSRVAGGHQQTLVASGVVTADPAVRLGQAHLVDYRTLAREVSAYQGREARKLAAARRIRRSRAATLAARINRSV